VTDLLLRATFTLFLNRSMDEFLPNQTWNRDSICAGARDRNLRGSESRRSNNGRARLIPNVKGVGMEMTIVV